MKKAPMKKAKSKKTKSKKSAKKFGAVPGGHRRKVESVLKKKHRKGHEPGTEKSKYTACGRLKATKLDRSATGDHAKWKKNGKRNRFLYHEFNMPEGWHYRGGNDGAGFNKDPVTDKIWKDWCASVPYTRRFFDYFPDPAKSRGCNSMENFLAKLGEMLGQAKMEKFCDDHGIPVDEYRF